MREFNSTAILLFIFCICIFPQTNQTLPCPKISVTGPAYVPKPDEPITFFASVGENIKNFNVRYLWMVSGGEILEGQGTNFIKVLLENPGRGLTANVKIEGLPENCENTFSETAYFESPPSIIKVEQFALPISKDNNIKNQSMFDALQNDPSAQLYVIIYLKSKTLQKTAIRREREIIKFLTEKNEIS